MNSKSKYLKFFAECLLVKGVNRSVIYDLPRNNFHYIPNSVYEFIKKYENKSLKDIKADFNAKEHKLIDEYISFLKEKDFIFFCDKDEIDLFPKLDLYWDYSGIISNTIIDVNANSNHNYIKIFDFLEKLGCRSLMLRFENKPLLEDLYYIMNLLDDKNIYSVELILPFFENKEKIDSFIAKYKRINNVTFYNSKFNDAKKIKNGMGYLNYISEVVDFTCNAKSSHLNFNVNIALFTESQKHNTFHNRKLYISTEGTIKNTPFTSISFKNINDIKQFSELLKIVNSSSFQKYWFIHKEICDVCKVCEHRHMCINQETPKKRNNNSWYYEKECNYNPYINKWKHEKNYHTLKEVGINCNKNEFRIDKEKYENIFEKVWGN